MPDNEFHNSGDGEQNIAQGDGAVGKQTYIIMQPLKLKPVAVASVLAVGIVGVSAAGYRLLTPATHSVSV